MKTKNEKLQSMNGKLHSENKQSPDLVSTLHESEEMFRLLFINSKDPIILIDKYALLDCNEATLQLLKCKDLKKILNTNIFNLSPEYQPDGKKSNKKAKEMINFAFKNGYNRFEWLNKDFDNNEFYIDVALTSIPYKGKTILFSVWHDISKQKEDENAFLQSEQKYKELFNQAADGILVIVGMGEIVNVNDSLLKLLGYIKEELIGSNIAVLFEKEELSNQPLRYDLVKKGDMVIRERNIIRKDGVKIPVEMNTKIISDGRIQALIRDISKRKETENELKKSRELLEKAETIAGLGRFIYNISSDIWESSSVLNMILGINDSYKKDFSSWMNIIHPDFQNEMENYFLNNILRDKELFDRIYKIVRINDKQERWVHGLGEIEYDSKNNPVRVLGTIQDITQIKETELALKESGEKYKSIFYNSPLGIMHYDKYGVITDCNQHFIDIIGSSKEKLVGLNMIKNLNNSKIIKCVKQSLKTGASYYEDWYFSVTAEKKTYVRIIFKRIKNTKNETISGICLVEDITEKNKAKQALTESEEKFRLLFESANDSIFLIKNYTFIDCNNKTLEIFGCKRKDIIGKQPYFFSPEFQPNGKPSKEEAIKRINSAIKGKTSTYEWVHTRLDGTPFYTEVSLNTLKIGNETIIQAIVRDVTLRKNAMEKLRLSEDKFSKIFDSTPDGIILTDFHTGKIHDLNKGYTQISGYTREESLGKSTTELNFWVNIQDRDNYMNRVINGKVRNFEFNARKKSGEIITVLISADIIRIEKDPYILAIFRNITERKIAEQKLIASEEKFRNIFNSTSNLIVISNTDGIIINVNEAILEISGLKSNQITGQNILTLVSEDYREEISRRINRLIKGEELSMFEIEAYDKNKELFQLEVHSKLIDYENEKAILIVARNINDRKVLERKLINTVIETEEKERQRLASDLHDEVGPLLSSLKMYINILSTNKEEEKGKYIIEQLKILVEESIHNIREVSSALNPYLLNKFGLKTAIESFFDKSKSIISVQFTTNIENKRFISNVEAVYYRIIKEMFNNTIKHANADKVEINLIYQNQNLFLEYSDNGVGFILEEHFSNKKRGMGIQNILNRIKTIDGKYSFQNKKKKGFNFELVTKCTIIDTNI
ncbi:MAG: hypothetical protein A2X13_11715 [Bacteroidetes bacterium GWC2_33_15]|nr:MAG: hypothetical protein A2X10_05740 [Bacteroidetes bacterium GWA2_33_15]OFX50805.1 MAG: hypothetical protein A2X13_11715 [Bacteroidetes bacterium GWC2_33_15]OFX62912.1 MAG: hypothetical protein A2X15_09655 [Bacteroidetes bacterium GWB2_32_14]OFX69982.1 MAG: hypothetical protein A2X14_02515 [Bacteroidetes bacterium GWD2_33_33]HAN18978.1 hypothetical protein [Bacteroidales bacterium]